MRKLTPREAVARAYPSWDAGMADRLIAWLDHCGYQIVEKPHAAATLAPDQSGGEEAAPRLERALSLKR